ncbi:predicted protein [Histoplasma mississippiense (nom. inval.)]|uniref:predicted protein n=1 Tax=Ajellomyces capsulatus (strain NAm1 / WU24) TaxID=2059318 RepID=UPI000157B55A|nr:predicted protein [Histoplasma mississippiense (nom. inval.)]EDN02599.1 predicted protein [Histoplasma mississippiense (nom. inval.)]
MPSHRGWLLQGSVCLLLLGWYKAHPDRFHRATTTTTAAIEMTNSPRSSDHTAFSFFKMPVYPDFFGDTAVSCCGLRGGDNTCRLIVLHASIDPFRLTIPVSAGQSTNPIHLLDSLGTHRPFLPVRLQHHSGFRMCMWWGTPYKAYVIEDAPKKDKEEEKEKEKEQEKDVTFCMVNPGDQFVLADPVVVSLSIGILVICI